MALCLAPNLSAQTDFQKGTAGIFVDALTHRDWNRATSVLHFELFQRMDTKKWQDMMNGLEAQGGRYQRHEYFSGDVHNGDATIVYRVHFAKDSLDFRMVIDSLSLIEGFWLDEIKHTYAFRLPPYVRDATYQEEMVMIGDSATGLPGTITKPNGPGQFATALLLHDSGPQDRDETIFGNKPFRDIAIGLATRGVLVLRYDKRTYSKPQTINPKTVTVKEEVLDDALNALRFLRSFKDVDTLRLSVVGHGLGAMLAPQLAHLDPGVKGIAMLGAAARPLETLAGDQIRFLVSLRDTLFPKDNELLESQLHAIAGIEMEKSPSGDMFMNAPISYYYDLHKRKSVDLAKQLGIPIFIVQGGKDFQIPMKDYEQWKTDLGGKSNVRFHFCENCFHLFLPINGAMSPENYKKEGYVDFDLIQELAKWCKRKW